jgi:hypothetical protein
MILRYRDSPSRRRLLIAGAAAAGAAILKPGWALFFLVPLFVAVVVPLAPLPEVVRRTWIFLTVSLVGTIAWVLYGEYSGFLRGQAADKFQPRLVGDPDMWKGWLSMIGDVLDPRPSIGSHTPRIGLLLLVALLACVAIAPRRARDVLIPLWAGYALFGVVFATHIQNHNYYSLMLVPLAALSVGAAIGRAAPALEAHRQGFSAVAVSTTVLIAGIAMTLALHSTLTDRAYGRTAAEAAAVGATINHRPAIVASAFYGEPLEYYGRFRGRWWPEDSSAPPATLLRPGNASRWPAPAEMKPPPRFFVVDATRVEPGSALARYLRSRARAGSIGRYRVYRIR